MNLDYKLLLFEAYIVLNELADKIVKISIDSGYSEQRKIDPEYELSLTEYRNTMKKIEKFLKIN